MVHIEKPKSTTSLLLVLLAALLVGTTALQAAPAVSEHHISGRVVGPDGAPVRGARVELHPIVGWWVFGHRILDGETSAEPAVATVTDAAGGFALEARSGMWRIVVFAKGFVPRSLALTPLVASETLPTLELDPAHPVEVRVRDADGRPIAGATVVGLGSRWTPDERRSGPSWRDDVDLARTDDAGRASLPADGEEAFRVQVVHAGLVPHVEELAGRRALDVRLRAAEPRPIRVLDAAGRPAPDVVVGIDGGAFPVARTDAEGRTVVPAEPGEEARVLLRAERGVDTLATLPAPAANEPPEETTIRLPAHGILRGRVVDAERGEAIADAVVWSGRRQEHFSITDRDGAYVLDGVDLANHAVRAASSGHLESSVQVHLSEGALDVPTIALPPTVALVGIVEDESGTALPGIEVRARPVRVPGMRSWSGWASRGIARSDASGRFRFDRLLPDILYELEAEATGFGPVRRDVLVGPDPVVLVLPRGIRGVGRVVDVEGQAIAGVEVRLRARADGELSRVVVSTPPSHLAVSDAEGRFELLDLGSGLHDLETSAPGWAPLEVPGIVVPDVASLPDGMADLGTVELVPGVPIEGRVVDREGQPLRGAEVHVADVGSWSRAPRGEGPPTRSGADGYFAVPDRAPRERVELRVEKEGFAPVAIEGVVVGNEEPLVVVLDRASTVRGRVVDAEGRPVAGAAVTVHRVQNHRGWTSHRRGERGGADVEGRFVLDAVAPGRIDLEVTHPGYQRVRRRAIEIPRDRDVEDLEIVLERGVEVRGRVLDADGTPLAEASVELVPTASQADRFRYSNERAQTDADGGYRLDGLPPGRQILRADHPAAVARARTVELAAGTPVEIDFRLARGQSVEGRVVDPEDRPVAGAAVMARGSTAHFREAVVTDLDGAFRLAGLVDGDYRIHVEHSVWASAVHEVTVAGASIDGLEIRLGKGGRLHGRILGVEPEELGGARILAYSREAGNRAGSLTFDGHYEVSPIVPGTWHLILELANGREHFESVTVPEGTSELERDLDLGGELALSGRITVDGEAVVGARILAGSREGGHGAATSGPDGRYRIEGLPAGRYTVHVMAPETGLAAEDELDLTTDREHDVALDSGRVEGLVVDAETGDPLGGARVHLESEGAEYAKSEVETDPDGRFSMAGTTGPSHLFVSHDGYAATRLEIQVETGASWRRTIRLEPSPGLVLLLSSPIALPKVVVAEIRHADGDTVVGAGELPVGEGGEVRWESLPTGRQRIFLTAFGFALQELEVDVPGTTPVRLAPQATLEVRIPELVGTGTAATVHVTYPDGRPYRISWRQTEIGLPVLDGRGRVPGLSAGTFSVRIEGRGREWTETVTLAEGEERALVLE